METVKQIFFTALSIVAALLIFNLVMFVYGYAAEKLASGETDGGDKNDAATNKYARMEVAA